MATSKKNPVPEWTAKDAAPFIYVPTTSDDKYSHGVLGMVTGSWRYPGAAILGADAAHHTGVGMVRYRGPKAVSTLVLLRRPEVVTVPARVNAWLIGSGMEAQHRTRSERKRLLLALESGLPVVIDAGALDLVKQSRGPVVITPHARELARFLTQQKTTRATEFSSLDEVTKAISSNPADWCEYAADELGVFVLLKGHETHVAAPKKPDETRFHVTVTSPTTWLATAGSGDVLAGILGALIATNKNAAEILGQLAATASYLHAQLAGSSFGGGPFASGDLSFGLPALVNQLIRDNQKLSSK